jgi:cell division protein FtsB
MRLKKNQSATKPKVRKLYSKPVLLLLIVAIILLARGTWHVYQKEQESRKNVAMVNEELQNLMKRKAMLQSETEKLATQEGIEAALREKYQVSKQGESVLVVVDKPLPPSAAEDNNNIFSKFWHSVSGIFKSNDEPVGQ